MRLYQLTGLAIEDLQNEYDELMKLIEYLKSLLASRELRLGVIKTELLEVKAKYADKRRTEITYDEGDLNYADLIPRHSCVITVSNTGYIKRVPADTYRTQHRGGVGIMETKDEDHVEHLFNADSHDLIFYFTDRGYMYWMNVYDIPEGARTGKGKAIINLIKIEPGEKVKAMLTLDKSMFDNPDYAIVMATRNGVIKKTRLSDFRHLANRGLRAIVIDEGDDLIGAAITDGKSEIILSTAKGMACRFVEQDVRTMGRVTRGVTGIRFKLEGDYIVSMEVVPAENPPAGGSAPADENAPETEAEPPEAEEAEEEAEEPAEEGADDDAALEDDGRPQLLVITSGGMGKRSYVEGYRLTKRGAKGVKNVNLRPGEEVIAALRVRHGDELILTTERGLISRMKVDEIRIVGRNSKGVKIMDLRQNDRITGASVVLEVEQPEVPKAEDDQLPDDAPVQTDAVTPETENPAPETGAGDSANDSETQE